ncbi:hypothetical protein ACHAXT_002213 [Thalassiosira profunda]
MVPFRPGPRPQPPADSRRFSVSDWDGAAVEELTADASSSGRDASLRTSGLSGDGDVPPDVQAAEEAAPVMDLGRIHAALSAPRRPSQDRRSSSDSADERQAQVSGPRHLTSGKSKRLSWIGGRRRSDAECDVTVAPSSSASRTSYSSSAGTNIWSKLLGGSHAEGLWDGLDGKKDAFDDDSLLGDEDPAAPPSCLTAARRGARRRGLGAWYEVRHWAKTIGDHPHIALVSLATVGILIGVGLAAINAEAEAYERKQKMNVEFQARETAEWFQNEFRKAMLPLYSVQQGVRHSGYFNELALKVGDYPLHAIPETDYLANPALEDVPKGRIYRNLTGICDDPLLQQRWREIVDPVNKENGLDDGSVFAYRLAPRNTFCLFAHDNPEAPDMNFGFDAGVSSRSKFWKKVTTDIFGVEDEAAAPGEDGAPPAPFAMPGLGSGQTFSFFGPFGAKMENGPNMEREWICGHLPVYAREMDPETKPLNVHGTEVEGGWGFVMNFLDWRALKDRSDIYERFAACDVEFELVRKEDGAWLASSPRSDLLTEENSLVVETESLHGVWQNRVGRIDGWSPPWYDAALAGIVIASIVLGFLVATVLVERQLHRDLVRKMLPRRAIQKLHRGQTVIERYNLVTIFFSDIVGFTSLAGSMRPCQVMKMLNELYTELDKLVEKHGVYKVETIGDAYMVVGGAPDRVPAPLAAERVALFALDAVQFVRDFRTKDGDQVFIRAGLASGGVVAGVVGEAMPRYCLFGDTVNFASRMESTSRKMKVQVSEVTYRLLQDAPNASFRLIKRMEGDQAGIHIKGKGHQITYWMDKSSPRDGNAKALVDVTPHELSKVNEADEWVENVEGGSVKDSSVRTLESAGYNEFISILTAGEERAPDIGMFTSDEIYAAMTRQEWKNLGHCESAGKDALLVAATDDRGMMIVRASALLEHHLTRVLKARDADAKLPYLVKEQLKAFVKDVAATYSDVHFHSLSHAMHVTTSMNKLLSVAKAEDPLNSFSLVFSALLHDAGHTGMSNKILTDTHHPLANKYDEDVPIAERESIQIAVDLLFRPEYESLRTAILPEVIDKIVFAKTLFQSILVTDIATPSRVKLGIERFEVSQDEQREYESRLCPLASYIEDVFEGVELEEEAKDEYPGEFEITHLGLQQCVRNEHLLLLSDVGHLMQGWENFVKWNFRLFKEINDSFEKGLCDDPRGGWYQGQIGFIENYILPLAKRSGIYFESFGEELVENVVVNKEIWTKHGGEATEIMIAAVEGGDDESSVLLRLYELPSL